nr:hypothetical protein Q903MT_gene2102 [Picea sitchensis]
MGVRVAHLSMQFLLCLTTSPAKSAPCPLVDEAGAGCFYFTPSLEFEEKTHSPL